MLGRIQGPNSANLHPQRFEEISALIQAQLMGGGQDELVEVAALEALSLHQRQGTASGELGVRPGLVKDLIDWGFENTDQAITLDELCTTIFASRPAIVHHCRQTFGTGFMALLKQIRLSQVNHVHSSPEVPQAIGSYTVRAIASHHGFQSHNHFARDYRSQSGESPSATLQLASAPGISVQSVSVAQSPQTAMALR